MVARSTFNPNALTYSDKEAVLSGAHGLVAPRAAYAEDRGKTDEELEAIWKAGNIYDPGHFFTPSDIEWLKARRAETLGKLETDTAAYEESLTPEGIKKAAERVEKEERAELRDRSIKQRREDPVIDARYKELQRRTTADLIRPDVIEYWEKSAREGAEEHKAALLGKARSMGLNAAQMEALSQGMQKADAAFEAKIEALRLESRRSAKEELENFTLLLQEQGSAHIATEQALALEKERVRSAESRTLWGAILGGVGGALGGVAGDFATAGNPLGALAGFSAGSAAGMSVGSAI